MTHPTITEQQLGDIPWLILRGERLAVFQALGAHARHGIQATVEQMPDLVDLRRRTTAPTVAQTLAAVSVASQHHYPRVWAELTALAEGAQVPFDDLLLLNLRGDLGTDDGTGCTDLAYSTPTRAVIAHNEDGIAWLDGRCTLLTLDINGDPPITTWWLPGFIPANTFVLTGNGLAWGIDHLTVPHPAHAPGRHFVARALQREPTPAHVAERLTTTPSAGGFAYTIGRLGHPDVTVIEAAAGHAWTTRVKPPQPFHWHTNHALHLPTGITSSYPNSEDRARFLKHLTIPDHPQTPWFLNILTGAPLPDGVRRDGADDTSVTLLTIAVDLLDQQATLIRRNGKRLSLPTPDLITGIADRVRTE
ncbi:C45 family autoproteolytic acyltransferase/hydolase [Plantactinospora sp. CA-290183]|uniref:C45 family autoproteolytic acyltransferase/hydolase n=1 Tax=Plantactinospora sp. CA-290183 TaxID=3240006 RepID=UPI003D92538C